MLILLGFDSFDGRRVQNLDTPAIDSMAEKGTMRTFDDLDPSELMTTVLWSSMLAGEHPKQLYPEYYASDSPFDVWVYGSWTHPLLKSLPTKSAEKFMIRRLSSILPRERQESLRANVRDHIGKQSYVEAGLENTESALDSAQSPRLISFPGINFDHSNKGLKELINNSTKGAFQITATAEKFERQALNADSGRLIRTLHAIESRQFDFLATHFFSLDLIQHVWASDPAKMQRWYGFYDHILSTVLRTAEEDDTVVVVSDHGMQTDGIHSKRAFFAASKGIWGDDSYRMEDLGSVLETELDREVHEPEQDDDHEDAGITVDEDTHQHLEDLGYF